MSPGDRPPLRTVLRALTARTALHALNARRALHPLMVIVFAVMTLATPRPAAGAEVSPAIDRKIEAPRSTFYYRGFIVAGTGVGFRFNNPYRLAKPLGDRAESLSTTAIYGDIGVGATFGDPHSWQHGGLVRYDRSLQGVPQHVITPSYVLLRRGSWLELTGRFALPVVLTPDRNVGLEIAVGGAVFVRAGIGIAAEIIGDLFFGAATFEIKRPIYPLLSGQLGLIVEWERLP